MTLGRLGTAALLVFAWTGAAQAQDRPVEELDVRRLPIDLRRIERALQQSALREERVGLNLRYQVEVFARTPALEFFAPDDNLVGGQAPYGGPTHAQMLEAVTPREFRAPVMDFNGLFRWLADKTK